MINFIFSLLAAFGIGFVGMSWYLGTYREYFSSKRVHDINMFVFMCFCLYIGVWANTVLIS